MEDRGAVRKREGRARELGTTPETDNTQYINVSISGKTPFLVKLTLLPHPNPINDVEVTYDRYRFSTADSRNFHRMWKNPSILQEMFPKSLKESLHTASVLLVVGRTVSRETGREGRLRRVTSSRPVGAGVAVSSFSTLRAAPSGIQLHRPPRVPSQKLLPGLCRIPVTYYCVDKYISLHYTVSVLSLR